MTTVRNAGASDFQVEKNNNAKLSATVSLPSPQLLASSPGFHTLEAEIATVGEESSAQRAGKCSDISKFHQKRGRRRTLRGCTAEGGLSAATRSALGLTYLGQFHFEMSREFMRC